MKATTLSRATLIDDLLQLQTQLAEIDQQGAQIVAAHQHLIATRQTIAGAIQYIERQLAGE